ncbi:MAG: hypothetical protein WC180_04410 [Candidatus Paceibacterota bacterium]|jgi:Tfp pilus assembly protein PilN
MIRINLLSPLDKENLKWEKINNLALKSIIWVLLAVAISVGVFLCSVEYLKTKKDAAAAELANIESLPATQEVDTIEKSLTQSKSKVEDIYAIQIGHVSWTTLFENIAGLIPAGARLTDIAVQEEVAAASTSSRKSQETLGVTKVAQKTVKAEDAKIKIQISGEAKTREILLALEGNLKSSDLFFDLQYDTKNYVESTDIEFKYTFYIYKQKLLK